MYLGNAAPARAAAKEHSIPQVHNAYSIYVPMLPNRYRRHNSLEVPKGTFRDCKRSPGARASPGFGSPPVQKNRPARDPFRSPGEPVSLSEILVIFFCFTVSAVCGAAGQMPPARGPEAPKQGTALQGCRPRFLRCPRLQRPVRPCGSQSGLR